MLVKIGNFLVNTESSETLCNGKPVRLSGREQALFNLLAQNKGKLMSQKALLVAMYGNEPSLPEIKIIDVYMCKLRKRLAAANGNVHNIATIWGEGYRLQESAEF